MNFCWLNPVGLVHVLNLRHSVDPVAHSSFSRRLRHRRAADSDATSPGLVLEHIPEQRDAHFGSRLRGALAAPSIRQPKDVLIGALKAAIQKIEGHVSLPNGSADAAAAAGPLDAHRWNLGCAALDRLLPQGLESGALHEVKASPHVSGASAADWITGFGFALRLAVRRALVLQASGPQNVPAWLLWCCPRGLSSEYGLPSAAGLAGLGLDPARFVIVETARASDALVALEDALRSSSLALAFGIFDDIALTPARRLSLAAQASGTPCLLLTHPASEASAATATRWLVRREGSAPHAFDGRAPGQPRFSVRLERCRARPQSCQQHALSVEWCDEARSFSLVSCVADRASGADQSRRRAEG